MTHTARLAFALVAAIAWAGEVTFLVGNTIAKQSLPAALWWQISFLTDWSCLFVAVIATAAALGRSRFSTPFWLALATAAIALVGLMFGAQGGWAVLARTGLTNVFRISSFLAHVATPLLMVAVWLGFGPHGGLRWRDAILFLAWPAAYLAQMFARGLAGGGYPYPFVDVSKLGWPPVLQYVGIVFAIFALLSLIVVAFDRVLGRRTVDASEGAPSPGNARDPAPHD